MKYTRLIAMTAPDREGTVSVSNFAVNPSPDEGGDIRHFAERLCYLNNTVY